MIPDFPVIYLTGAPASGKTSVAARLGEMIPSLHIFSYGAELTRYLQRQGRDLPSQEVLRERSGGIATEEDIDALDAELIALVARERSHRPILVDSHAVTKESYGFRVTPFPMDRFKALLPTRIVVLYASPEVTQKRIRNNPGGRPMVTTFESGIHTGLQASVAIIYAIGAGIPIHFLDSAQSLEVLSAWIGDRISPQS